MPRARVWAASALAAFAVGAPSFSAAQTAPRFEDLLRDVQATAPRLTVTAAEVRAAEGTAQQASVRPNPTLDLEVENFAGRGPYEDFEAAETTLSITQPVELGGKRGARVSAARADLAAARARSDLARIDFARDLALAYAGAEASQLRRAIAEEAVDLARSDARAARLLVDNGKEAELRAIQAQAALSSAEADLMSARAGAETALARLSALAGAPSPYVALAGGLLERPAAPALSATMESPAIAVARAERDAATRRTALERSRRAPDVAVSFGVRRLEGDDSTAAVMGLSAPLPLFDRNRGAVAAASANAQAAQARLAMAQADLIADLRAARGEAAAAEASLSAARQGEAAAAEAHRLARIGYEAGRLPLSELLAARRTLVEARTRGVDTRLTRVRALADLARAQGQTPFGETP